MRAYLLTSLLVRGASHILLDCYVMPELLALITLQNSGAPDEKIILRLYKNT